MLNLDEINQSLAPLRRQVKTAYILAIVLPLLFMFTLMLATLSAAFGQRSMIGFYLIIMIISMSLGIYYIISTNKKRKRYALQVKEVLSDTLFKPRFENYGFYPELGFDYQTIRELDLLPTGDSYRSNDVISGTLHKVNFVRADVHTTTTTYDHKGHATTFTNFRGQVFSFNFFKKSHSYLRIRDRSHSKFGRGRKVEQAKPIQFEDGTFNDLFRCYSNNDHEAFYLFTPQLMQKLIDFRQKLNLQFSLVIHDSMLYLAIYSNTDAFEPSIWRDLDQTYLNQVIKDLDIITTIINDLDLQNSLFK